MRTRGWLSTLAGFVGCAISIGPWLYFDSPGIGSIILTCLGAALVGIARADTLAHITNKTNPGDDLLTDLIAKVGKILKR